MKTVTIGRTVSDCYLEK